LQEVSVDPASLRVVNTDTTAMMKFAVFGPEKSGTVEVDMELDLSAARWNILQVVVDYFDGNQTEISLPPAYAQYPVAIYNTQ
jgi:hypothetical protein